MESRDIQTPAGTNQIEDQKPNVPKARDVIPGEIACSMNGGHYKTIHWQYVMAGQYIEKGYLNLNIQMLTPKTPAFQRLKMNVKLVYVPNERVHKNYIEMVAQRGGTTVAKITEKPNFGGKLIPEVLSTVDRTYSVSLFSTTLWRDHWMSAYFPRMGYQGLYPSADMPTMQRRMPTYDATAVRAFIATFNDVLRNKEYQPPLEEFNGDTVSDYEWQTYMPNPENPIIPMDVQFMRCRRDTSYYTDYRTDLQGLDLDTPVNTDGDRALLEWASWESKIDLARQNAENAQMRDIDILAKIRGSKKLSEGRVQVLAQKTFDLNYSAITQSAYNTNEEIDPKFQVMGQQGAYSYTNISLPLGEDIMFLSDGTLHIIATVTADTVFETALYRQAMNVRAIDLYRPELEDDKLDVIYEYEFGTEMTYQTSPDFTTVRGYKRRFNEYFHGNNVIQGDMTTNGYFETTSEEGVLYTDETYILSNSTYQFFETSANLYAQRNLGYEGYSLMSKKIYYDYTDLAINDNQAILNEIGTSTDSTGNSIWIKGQNQIFMVGQYIISTTIPVSEKVKNSYSEWGEH